MQGMELGCKDDLEQLVSEVVIHEESAAVEDVETSNPVIVEDQMYEENDTAALGEVGGGMQVDCKDRNDELTVTDVGESGTISLDGSESSRTILYPSEVCKLLGSSENSVQSSSIMPALELPIVADNMATTEELGISQCTEPENPETSEQPPAAITTAITTIISHFVS